MRKLLILLGVIIFILFFSPSVASAQSETIRAPSTSSPPRTVAEMEAAADLHRINKDYVKAIALYHDAINKDKRNAVLYNKMGIAEIQTGDFVAAISAFDRAAKLNRRYGEPLNNRGVVAYLQKDYRKAVKFYNKAITLNPENASFHNNLGTALFAQHKTDEAMQEILMALRLDPEVLARSERGGVAAQVIASENRAEYSYMLARLHARIGDVNQCLECLRKAREAGYSKLENVYKDPEFESIRRDARLTSLVPAPVPR